jgi:hypothetical protein
VLAVGSVFGLAGVLAPAQAEPAEVTAQRFFEATVNIAPGASESGFAGAVRFRAPLDEPTTVELFLSASEPVTCDDGTESEASRSVRALETDVGEPNQASLEMGRALRTASGTALVDLEVVESPGCGAPETVTILPDQLVSIDVTGTSVLFHTGVGGGTASGPDQAVDRSEDFSRDGVGTATVGSLVENAPGEAFLRYGVDRTHRHGTPLPAPDPAAPPGGFGASASFAASFEPEGGLGVVFEDAFVTATVSAPPERAETLTASALRVTLVRCEDGSVAEVLELLDGAGSGEVSIPRDLSTATGSAVLELRRETTDGCRPGTEPVDDVVTVPVTLDLHATGPEVRVSNLRWHLIPGEGMSREFDWYRARQAAGTIAVGDIAGTAELGSIARAGR